MSFFPCYQDTKNLLVRYGKWASLVNIHDIHQYHGYDNLHETIHSEIKHVTISIHYDLPHINDT